MIQPEPLRASGRPPVLFDRGKGYRRNASHRARNAGGRGRGALPRRDGVGQLRRAHRSCEVRAEHHGRTARRARRIRRRRVRPGPRCANQILAASATPNDPRYAEEYGLNNTGQTAGTPDADIDAPEGWDAAGLGAFPNSGGALVGIVDTGIRATHEDLAGKVAFCAKSQGPLPILSGSIQEGSCADDNGHGSHTSGTITANTNNGKGVAGVAFNSKLAVCKALGGPLGQGSTADVANCIVWAHNKGAKVISMSLGGGDSTTLHSRGQRR